MFIVLNLHNISFYNYIKILKRIIMKKFFEIKFNEKINKLFSLITDDL